MRVCLLILFSLVSMAGWAQELAGVNITPAQGLPSNTVYDLFQDRDGFLWVATENGIARYNGKTFRTYENSSIRSKAVSGIFQDSLGRIWCHNFFGEILYLEQDSLKKLNAWEKFYSGGFPIVTDLGNRFLISSPNHLYFYFLETGRWQNLDSIFQPENPILLLDHTKAKDGRVWMVYTQNRKTFVGNLSENDPPIEVISEGKNVNSQLASWTVHQNELLLFERQSKKLFSVVGKSVVERTDISPKTLLETRQVKSVSDSLLGFLSNIGIKIQNQKNEWRNLVHNKNISACLQDSEGGFWIGTLNEGLLYFPFRNSAIHPKEKFGLFKRLVWDKNQQRVFAGGYQGNVEVFSERGKHVTTLPKVFPQEIQSLYVDPKLNQLFVFSDMLYAFNLSTLRPSEGQIFVSVKRMDRINEELVLATSAGLVFYNPLTKSRSTLVNNQRLSTVTVDSLNQKVWIGSQLGILTYSMPDRKISRWPEDSVLTSPGTSAMLVSGKQIFIGTQTDGLYIENESNKSIHLTQQNGLPSNHITALAHQGKQLWLGTDNGVCLLDLQTMTPFVIDATRGLASLEIHDLLLVHDKLWVSHALGLQLFETLLANERNQQRPIIHINGVTSDQNQLAGFTAGILLTANSQQLSVEFDVSNNLRSRGKTKIFYRIKELNESWHQTTLETPTANFLSLPYGNLTFEAYAENEDGLRSVNTSLIPISVQAPFWKTSWFLVVLLLAVFSLASWIIFRRQRISNEQNKARLEHQNQEHQLRIAQLTSIRAQMNPHFIFNTMALIQGKILNGLRDEANENIQSFSALMRKVLDFSGREMITLQEEIEVLEKYLSIENDRLAGSLSYSIHLDPNLEQEPIRIPSLITQPFVENALRHGLMHKQGNKKLLIQFQLTDRFLKITIEDNGIGRRAAAEFNKARGGHQSFALTAYQKRIDLLNAYRTEKISLNITDLQNEQKLASGTRVVISIPTTL
jgi:ligand-binding sensor domain-containing protein